MIKLERIIEKARSTIMENAGDLVSGIDAGDDHFSKSVVDALTQIIISRDDDKSIRKDVMTDYVGEDPYCWLFLTGADVDRYDVFEVKYPDGEVVAAKTELLRI